MKTTPYNTPYISSAFKGSIKEWHLKMPEIQDEESEDDSSSMSGRSFQLIEEKDCLHLNVEFRKGDDNKHLS